MAVKIRLARGGAKKKPYYRVVVANDTAPRDGDFLEKVGTYNPLLPKDEGNRVVLKADRITYWLSQGAAPTDTVAKFIEASGIELPGFVASKMDVKNKARQEQAKKKALADAEKAASEAAEVAKAQAADAEKAAAEVAKAQELEAASTPAAEAIVEEASENPVAEETPVAE